MNLDSLLISQDAALLGVLRPALEKISVNVQVCVGSQPGNNLLAKRKFDAVIIDCDDLENGFDLLRALRQTQSNAKSVSFAVVNGKTTTQEAFQSGANFVLQKPLTPLHASRCFNAALNLWCGNGAGTSAIRWTCRCESAFRTTRNLPPPRPT